VVLVLVLLMVTSDDVQVGMETVEAKHKNLCWLVLTLGWKVEVEHNFMGEVIVGVGVDMGRKFKNLTE